MSRNTQTRRLTRPVSRATTGGPERRTVGADPTSLVSLLTRTPRLLDLLPQLHQLALDAAGGTRSLLFERDARSGVMQATSACGLDVLRTDPWVPEPEEAAV